MTWRDGQLTKYQLYGQPEAVKVKTNHTTILTFVDYITYLAYRPTQKNIFFQNQPSMSCCLCLCLFVIVVVIVVVVFASFSYFDLMNNLRFRSIFFFPLYISWSSIRNLSHCVHLVLDQSLKNTFSPLIVFWETSNQLRVLVADRR